MTASPDPQQPSGLSRRSLAAGAAWALPAVAIAASAPAQAASLNQMTATVTPQMFQTVYSRTPAGCSTTTNPQKGYIDTMCCGSPVTPRNGDCNQNPSTSQGLWLESSTGAAGKAEIVSATITYTFNHNVAFDGTTFSSGTANTSGTSTWNSPDILGAGWTITSKTATSITLKYSGSGLIDASTATNGTGFCTGYFINFRVTDGCYLSGGLTVTTSRTVVYSDKSGLNKTWTRTSGPTGI